MAVVGIGALPLCLPLVAAGVAEEVAAEDEVVDILGGGGGEGGMVTGKGPGAYATLGAIVTCIWVRGLSAIVHIGIIVVEAVGSTIGGFAGMVCGIGRDGRFKLVGADAGDRVG